MISYNPKVSVANVVCSLDTRYVDPKYDYHKKWMDMIAYVPVELNYLEILAKNFIFPAIRHQFIQENIFNSAPVGRNAIAMNTNYPLAGFYTANPFRYQQFDLRQIIILRGGHPIVNVDAADNCRLYFTTMKAFNFQDGILPSIPVDKSEDHYVLMFDLTSMYDAAEKN